MSEVTYEGMFLLDSNKYASNPDAVIGEISAILDKAGAKLLASRPWQEGKLAYPMDGHRKGLYFLTYFSMDSKGLHEVNRLCKFNETIIRHLILKLDPALVEPMLAMATGRGEIVSTFKDTDSEPIVAATDVVVP